MVIITSQKNSPNQHLPHALHARAPVRPRAPRDRDARRAARPLPEPSRRLYCCRNQRRKGTSPRVASSCRASKPWTLCAAVVEHSAPPRFFSRANRLWLPINRAESRRRAPLNSQSLPLQHTARPNSSSSSSQRTEHRRSPSAARPQLD